MGDSSLLDLLRARQPWALAVGLGLVVASLLVAHEAYGRMEETAVVEERPLWLERAAYEYSVPVTRNGSIWPIGHDLGMGQPIYYRTVAQFVHVNFTWSGLGADEDVGIVQADMLLRVRGQDRLGRVLWEVEHPMGRAYGTPADGVRVAGSVDLDQLYAESVRLVTELPLGDGMVNWTIETSVAYAVRAQGHDEAEVERYLLVIQHHDPRFGLPPADELRWEDAHAAALRSTRAEPARWQGALGDLTVHALAATGVALLALAWWARRSDPARGLPPALVPFARERARFAEWITPAQGDVPTSGPTVDVGCLADLVRVAADSRARVLLHEGSRTYFVVLPTLTYRYAAG